MSKTRFIHSLSGRLLFLGVIPAMLIIAAIVALATIDDSRDLRAAEAEIMNGNLRGAAAELSTRNDRWNNVIEVMSFSQANGLFGQRKSSSELARSVTAAFPLIIGAYFIYEPNADGQDSASLKSSDFPPEAMDAAGRFVPYWYRDAGMANGPVKLKANNDMDTLEYYQGPKGEFAKTGKAAAFVTEPYVYEGVQMISHTVPIVIQNKFAGIAGVDRGLITLSSIASDLKNRCGADVFVLSRGGRIIAASTSDSSDGVDGLLMKSVADTRYASIGPRWLSNSDHDDVFEAHDPVLNEMCFYATSKVSTGGWTVVGRRPKSEVMHAANVAILVNVIVGLVGLSIVGGLMFFTARTVSGRVRRAAEAADRIARGDLTQKVDDSANLDETGQLIRSMGAMDGNLNSLVGSVKQASIRLNSTATEIAATSKQQEASASTFGAASSQIAAAVKEISATSQNLVRTMENVSEMAVETADLAGVGRAGLQGMESVMHDLDRATTSIAEKLAAINERSQKITTVITTITKVADQTNILSINAAIEAEKAGEFGAGFLVIAREIRRLADQTAAATLDIEQMVQQMQTAVSAGVMEMDRFSDQVRRGVRDVASAGSQLTEIIDRVNRSTDSFKQVNESMQAQSEGAAQISDAMGSLAGNANQTMQSVQEFGRAAADLQSAIAMLRQAVAQFKLRE